MLTSQKPVLSWGLVVLNSGASSPGLIVRGTSCLTFAELDRYPMIIDINKKILNYLSYLQDEDDNSIVKQSLQISIAPYNSGQNSFYSNIMKMSEYFNLFDFNYNSLSDSKIKQLVDLMKKKNVSYWNQTLQHSLHQKEL